MTPELRMAELLCTRLCHDLTGPIGAVNNGAEFLTEEGFNLQNQAVELIVSSAFSAVSRLQFYRFAYGRVKDHGEAPLAEKQKMAADFFSGTKITLDWPDQYTDAAGVSISMKMVRLLFNLLILASGALLKGGDVSISIAEENHTKIVRVVARGAALKWDPEADQMIRKGGSVEQITPKNVQYYLTYRLAEELGATLAVKADGETLLLEAAQPVAQQLAAAEG